MRQGEGQRASVDNSSELWETGAGGPECGSQIEEVVGGVVSRLAGLYLKGTRDCPTLGGVVPPGLVNKVPDIKASKYRKRKT